MRFLLVLSGLLLAWPALAAPRGDVTKIACSDRGSFEDTMWVVYWIDGYLSGRKGDPKFNESWVELVGEAVEEACKGNPERSLYSIIEERRKRR